MGKISRIALIVLLAAVSGLFAWAVLRAPEPEREPVYQGKPLSYWLEGLGGARTSVNSGATSTPTWQEAHTAMGAIGTNAIPFLLRQLRQRNSLLREKCFFLLQRQHFIKIQLTSPWTHSMQASAGLMELHEKAGSAVPQLIAIYDGHADSVQRQIITSVLAFVGPTAKEAVPLLLRGLTDTDEFVRNNSAYALGRVHAKPELVLPALVKSLHDPSPNVRANAADSLGTFGEDAQSALPALQELLIKERAATSGSNFVAGARFNLGTIVSYQAAPRSKGARVYPFSGPANVIGPVEKAIKAIDPTAAGAESETNQWREWDLPPAR